MHARRAALLLVFWDRWLLVPTPPAELGAVCREPFVQVELEPTAAAGPELFAEAGERGVEVETLLR